MRKFLAATAALAMAATMAHAEPGKGNKGGGNGGGHAAQAHGGSGKDRGPSMKQDRGPKQMAQGPQRADKDRGPDRKQMRDVRPAKVDRKVERQVKRDERKFDRKEDRRVVERVRDNDYRDGRREYRSDRIVNVDYRDDRGLIDGCPPGLAKKGTNCTPPGLFKKQGDYRYRDTYYRPDWWGYGSLGDRVYYDDGYLYRMSGSNSILGYIPLLGGALSVGNVWPQMYQPVPVPNYYVDYYNLGPQGSYRYADNVLYRVDPETAAITSIAALLTGDDFSVGQPMPLGYDVYNVPYAYRDRYYDRPDALYRYSDGYVYQVDPETRLVAAAIELLI